MFSLRVFGVVSWQSLDSIDHGVLCKNEEGTQTNKQTNKLAHALTHSRIHTNALTNSHTVSRTTSLLPPNAQM